MPEGKTEVQRKVPWFPDQQEDLQDPPHQNASHLQVFVLSRSEALVSSVTLVGIEICTRLFREAIDTSLSLHRRSGVG